MGIIQFLIICGMCAGLYWFINWLFSPPPVVNKIMLVAIVILLLVLLLQALGLWPIQDMPIPRVTR
jgi:predicted ABC-type exoprotein transport system permease subunit